MITNNVEMRGRVIHGFWDMKMLCNIKDHTGTFSWHVLSLSLSLDLSYEWQTFNRGWEFLNTAWAHNKREWDWYVIHVHWSPDILVPYDSRFPCTHKTNVSPIRLPVPPSPDDLSLWCGTGRRLHVYPNILVPRQSKIYSCWLSHSTLDLNTSIISFPPYPFCHLLYSRAKRHVGERLKSYIGHVLRIFFERKEIRIENIKVKFPDM
jgi:hypothetical protein